MTTLIDQTARDRIRDALEESLCIEAGAGTGKTTALVSRVVNVLRTGHAKVDEIAVITFTEAAAAELAGRVREGLEEALENTSDGTEGARIHEALSGLYRSHVETIHAFCGNLLRERPVEAGLDPAFQVADDLTARIDFETAYAAWQAELLSGDTRAVAMAINRGLGLDGIRSVVEQVDRFRELTPLDLPAAQPADVDGFVLAYHAAADELRTLQPLAARDEKASAQIETVLAFAELLREAADDRDWLERQILNAAPKVLKTAGAQAHWNEKEDCRKTKALFVELREAIEAIQPAMRAEALVGVLPLAQDFVIAREQQRRAEGVADFDDLLNWSRNLLRDSREAREYFRKRFRVVFVDEFQDTDPVQAEIALLLTSGDEDGGSLLDLRPRPGALTVVGDPKQSIYRFRRADIAVYDAVRNGPLAGAAPQLVQNFRSTSGVIAWVNDVFDRALVAEPGVQPGNIALVPGTRALTDESRSICVVRAEPAETAQEARTNEARLIAGTIRRAIEEEWPVREGETERPAQWRDVAILFPARTGLELFEEALRRSEIPYRVEGGRSFFARQEIRDLSAVLAAIDDPLDQVSLVAALRSAAFGCSDEDLYLHVARGGRLDYRSDATVSPEAVQDAFAILLDLHRLRAGASLSRLVRTTVERIRMIEGALAGWDGQQAAANLAKLVEQARAFSMGGGGGLRAFARWLAEQRGGRNTEEAGIAEASDDAVRLATMHASKGLEYPIVALANLGARSSHRVEPVTDRANRRLHLRITSGKRQFATPGFDDEWTTEEAQLEAEAFRLLYVATTRARDRLIIPVSYSGRSPGPRLAALMESLPSAEAPTETTTAGCFVIDPATLSPLRDDEPPPGNPPASAVVEAELTNRAAWDRARQETLRSAQAELAVHPASKDEGDSPVSAALLGADDAPVIAGEGPPAEKGEALHKVLELVDLRNPTELEAVVSSVCQVAGIAEHMDDVLAMTRACLESDALSRARAAKELWREAPYTLRVEDGYATGRIDVIFEENSELVVIDWKSDAIGPSAVKAAADSHRAQARAYVRALEAVTAMPVKEVVFVFPRAKAEAAIRFK
jgi:ATP-dependent exoDNAse (exonuclease V) beta subunit